MPCHRVVASSFELGGFEGSKDLLGKNLTKKRKMLVEEGVEFEEATELQQSKGTFKVSRTSIYTY